MPRPISVDPIEVFFDEWVASGRSGGLPMAATASVTRSHRVLLARNEATLRSFGLTFARCEALMLLLAWPGNRVPMSRMSEWLMVHPTSVTNTVDRLAQHGLVNRAPHPTDRRALMVELTDSGRGLAEGVVAALADDGFGVHGLTHDEMRTLVALLRKVRRAGGEFRVEDGEPTRSRSP